MNKKTKEVLHELKHHYPFTLAATIFAILVVIFLQFVINIDISEHAFEILHPLHVIASAIVTAGIYYKYKPKFFQAFLVGISGAIIIGSLSDIIFPWLGGNILQLATEFHLPIIEETTIILSSAIIGAIIGIASKKTKIPHFAHVLISVFASLFYLMAFTPAFNLIYFIGAFIVIFIAVIIPCCVSDILYPHLFLGKDIKSCDCKH